MHRQRNVRAPEQADVNMTPPRLCDDTEPRYLYEGTELHAIMARIELFMLCRPEAQSFNKGYPTTTIAL